MKLYLYIDIIFIFLSVNKYKRLENISFYRNVQFSKMTKLSKIISIFS